MKKLKFYLRSTISQNKLNNFVLNFIKKYFLKNFDYEYIIYENKKCKEGYKNDYGGIFFFYSAQGTKLKVSE